jgi:GWxTD domain-containing protein
MYRQIRSGIFTFLCVTSASLYCQVQVEGLQSEETFDYFQKWLNQDVVYIINSEERQIFEDLNTDEEREQFIEQFWFRRDPDPTTAINEFKEEHYRRVAYANDRFTSGKPGWRTDR